MHNNYLGIKFLLTIHFLFRYQYLLYSLSIGIGNDHAIHPGGKILHIDRILVSSGIDGIFINKHTERRVNTHCFILQGSI